ncbi:DUF2510 domain-containing protein [Mycolicibacterium fortuitum]
MTTPAGWYPDPSGAPGTKYWDGHRWLLGRNSSPKKLTTAERLLLIFFCMTFGGLAAIFSIAGEWKAVGGVAVMAVLIGAPVTVIMLAVRAVKQSNQTRASRRTYEAGLMSRLDQQHQAMLRGDIEAGVFGDFQPPPLPRSDAPDAEQMRQQAWQPDLSGPSPAVRPDNPAPWHLVTQFPTRKFTKQADQQASEREDSGPGRAGAPR